VIPASMTGAMLAEDGSARMLLNARTTRGDEMSDESSLFLFTDHRLLITVH
jgi:hypothetical protein